MFIERKQKAAVVNVGMSNSFLLRYLETVSFLLKYLFLLVGSTNSEQQRLSCLPLSSFQIKTNWEVWEALSWRRHYCKSVKFWSREKNIDSFSMLPFLSSFTFWPVQHKIWCDESWKEFFALIASFIHMLFIQQIFLSMYYVPGSVLGLGVKWWSKSWWRKPSVHIWLFIQISPLLWSHLLNPSPD